MRQSTQNNNNSEVKITLSSLLLFFSSSSLLIFILKVAYVPRGRQPGAASAPPSNPNAIENKSGPSILKSKSNFKGSDGVVR